MSNATLKWIAIITMFIDHVGAILFPNIMFMRLIGRIAFPIFAFLIAEGFLHTRNVKRYILRLGVFAVISEIPFDLAVRGYWFDITYQNVFFTLFLGLIAIAVYDHFKLKQRQLGGLLVLFIGIIAYLLRTDYNIFGILMIFVFYFYKNNFSQIVFYLVYINALMAFGIWAMNNYRLNPWNFIQVAALISLVFINKYNGSRGRSFKYFFYLFYPVHLILLYLIKVL